MNDKVVNILKGIIYRVLVTRAEGYQNGIKRHILREFVKEEAKKFMTEIEYNIFLDFENDRRFRQIVSNMINDNCLPIGTHHNYGYFICKTQADFDIACDEFKAKILSMVKRMKKLQGIIEENTGTQLEFKLN